MQGNITYNVYLLDVLFLSQMFMELLYLEDINLCNNIAN